MFCSSCGTPLQPSSRFCSFCGAPVAERGATASSTATGQPPSSYASQANDVPPGDASGSESWSTRYHPGAPPPPFARLRLTRPRSPRLIAGVCSGLALHYGWDINLVRILVAVFSFFFGTGILAYLAAWIIIPDSPYTLHSSV